MSFADKGLRVSYCHSAPPLAYNNISATSSAVGKPALDAPGSSAGASELTLNLAGLLPRCSAVSMT